jgi:hypothetical protein
MCSDARVGAGSRRALKKAQRDIKETVWRTYKSVMLPLLTLVEPSQRALSERYHVGIRSFRCESGVEL